MIKAEIVKDSVNIQGDRITTFVVTFPRMILAELNTHRMFSRNSASSRAIPFKKMVEVIENNPFIPIAWQKDHKGMQGKEYFEDKDSIESNIAFWLDARDNALTFAKILNDDKVTKQLCNRLLEPFMWHTVIITATEFENFFALRCPRYVTPVGGKNEDGSDWEYRSKKDVIEGHSNEANLEMMDNFTEIDWLKINKGQAEIHAMALAEAMWDAYNESVPQKLKAGEWHIPFVENLEKSLSNYFDESGGDPDKYNETYIEEKVKDSIIKISTAQCARVSYTTVGEGSKELNIEKDIELHDRMAKLGHWSPFEHCGRAMTDEEYEENVRGKGQSIFVSPLNNVKETVVSDDESKGWSGNFKGFIQYRKTFNNENKI